MRLYIWERYFLRETLKVLFLIIFTFFGLYVLIDYSIHANLSGQAKLSFFSSAIYYLCEFSKRLDVLLPFSLLIATIKTLCDLAVHQELVALMASGIPIKRLLRPFLMIGLVGTACILINAQFILPVAQQQLKGLAANPAVKEGKSHQATAVQQLTLPNGTSLLYLHYDPENQAFHNVYWISNFSEVYHMKTLYPFESPPRGTFVTHFERDNTGHLADHGVQDQMLFSSMPFDTENVWKALTTPSDQSLSTIWKQIPTSKRDLSEKDSQVITTFYQKLALPWLCQ